MKASVFRGTYFLSIFFVLAFFAPLSLYAQTKYQSAFLQGTQTNAPSSPTNLNQATPYAIQWSSSDFDSDYFSHSTSSTSERLTVTAAGDYLLSATLPITSVSARQSVQLEVYVNGAIVDGSIGESTYTRLTSGHVESSAHIALLLPGLSVNDYIEVFVVQAGNNGTTTIDEVATLYVEYIPSGTRTVYSATSTGLTSGTNLNVGTAPEITWQQGRIDSGITHSNGASPEHITLDTVGNYLVFFNIPISGSVTRGNIQMNVLLDGATVPGGHAKQGYIRNTSGHNEASLHWSGIVRTTSPNQVLTFSPEQEGAGGTITITSGKTASVYVERLPATQVYAARATQLTGASPDNWNPTTAESILWATDDVIDTGNFSHSTSTNAHQITVLDNGDYLLVYNDSLTSTVQRPNPRVTVRVNNNPIAGAETSSHYIRSSSGHNESSGSLVFMLSDLQAGDVIDLSVEAEALTGTVNDDQDALLVLWQKSTRYNITGRITAGPSVVSGATVTLSGDVSDSTTTDANGDYSFTNVRGDSSYTVTPSLTGYTFSPTDSSGTLSADVTHDFSGTLNTYDITGTITVGGSPFAGATVTLSGDASGTTTTDASGNYTFSNVDHGTNYVVTPTHPNYDFTPLTHSGTLTAAADHDFTGALKEYTLSGRLTDTITGNPLIGASVTLTGDSSGSTTTDGNGDYSFSNIPFGDSYTVTPTFAGYEFTPTSTSGSIAGATTVNFVGAALRTISGNITFGGSPLQNVTIQLSGDESAFTSTDASGDYSFANIPEGTSYTVTPSLTGYSFSPTDGSGSLSGNAIHDFTATVSQHFISGTITVGGAPLSGVTITLTGDETGSTTTDANGDYTLNDIDYGSNYTVTPSLSGYIFAPIDSSGVITNNLGIDFAATVTYTISGTITDGSNPISGVTVTLSGDENDSTTTDGSGNYTLSGIPSGSAYTVTPTRDGYTFSPTSLSGTLNSAADLDFTGTLSTYSISGTITDGGSPLSGVTVNLSGDTSDSTTTDGSGNYTFGSVNHGTNYTVTPQLTGYFFLPISSSGTLTSAADHDFTATVSAGNTKVENAFLQGTVTTAPVTPENLNQTTQYSLVWANAAVDNAYFEHPAANPEQLVVKQAGDYLVAATLPVTGTAAHGAVQLELYVNGNAVAGSVSESSYIRAASGHNESSSQIALLLENLAVDDYVEVRVQGRAGPGTITVNGHASLYAEAIADGSRTVFAGTSTALTSGTNLNVGTLPELTWTEGRKDTGYVHSDVGSPQDIRLSDAGDYLVFINVPISSSSTTVSAKLRVRLDGVDVPGGQAMQGFVRNTSGHNDSSIHWSGIVSAASASQVLSIAAEQEAATGTITLQSGKAASIYIERLPASEIFFSRATNVTGVSPTDWNPSSEESALWENDVIIDSGDYSHSTSTNAHEVTVQTGGDYFLVYNNSFTSATADSSPSVNIYVNGTAVSGLTTSSHYISTTSGHNESSGSLVSLLQDLNGGDVVTVRTVAEAGLGSVTAQDDALFSLWKKSDTHIISGNITVGGSPLQGVEVSLSGDASRVVTTDASGDYTFSGVLDGASYTVTPTLAGYTFSPTSSSGTLSADTTHDFTATLNTHTISGTITDGGSPQSGVTVTLSGGASGTTTTDGSGNYSFAGIDYGVSYTVTPSLAGFVYTPTDSSGTLTGDVIHDFTAAGATYSISGNIRRNGSALSGVTINLTGGVTDSTTTDINGDYSFTGLAHGLAYTVTPTLAGNIFSPTDSSGTLTSNTTHDFTSTLTSHTISGTVTDGGLPQSGVTVVITGDVSDFTTTDGSGNYSFTVDYGTSYTVTPTFTGYSYSPTSSSGTISTNVTHDFAGSESTYSVSGTITEGGLPLSGVTVNLTGDITDSATTDGSGNYSISGIPYGTNFTLTPTLAGYTITPNNVVGTLTQNQSYDFTASFNTYDITGTILLGGLPLEGVTVTRTGDTSDTAVTDSNGDYTFAGVDHGTNYTLTPTLTGYTFSPSDVSGTLTDAISHDFAATANTYNVTGTITDGGSPLAGVTVSISGDVVNSTTTDGSGNYAFNSLDYGTSYTVTPTLSGYFFAPGSTSNTLTANVAHDFSGSIDNTESKSGNALLHGSRTTNSISLNETTPYAIQWSSSDFDSGYFSHSTSTNSERLTVTQSGDYFVAVTLPVTSALQRSAIELEVYVNGAATPGAVGNSSYIRNTSDHTESSSHIALLLPGLTANDYVEVFVRGTALAGTVTVLGQASLYAERIDPSSRTVFSATATTLSSGSDLNAGGFPALEWTEGREDTGFTHDNGVNPENITLDTAGDYLVTFNLPMDSTIERASVKALIQLDGATVTGGEAKQGYIRSLNGHNESSVHWSGIVRASSANQVLSIVTEQEAAAGTVNIMSGKAASIFVERLPATGIYAARATELNSGTVANWNQSSPGSQINWANDDIIDTGVYSHSTSTDAHQITVLQAGDYIVYYNDSFTSTVQRANPKVTLEVNGVERSGATVASHYIRSDSGHNESSGSLVYLLEDLEINDIISLRVVQEALAGTVNDSNEALIVIQQKSVLYPLSGTITVGGSPLEGVTVTLSGDASGSAVTDSNGDYSFPKILDGTSYTVTPVLAGYTFTPTDSSGTVSGATTEDFTATLNNYTISGTLTDGGTPLSGITVSLTGDVTDSTTTDGSGNYSFVNIDHGTNYTVTPSAVNYDFTPASTSGLLVSNEVHDFTGSVRQYTLGGRVRDILTGVGISGFAVNLTGDVTDSTTTNVNGDYVFSNLDHGTNYVVTPVDAGYQVVPTSKSGTLVETTAENFQAAAYRTISGTILIGGSPLSAVTVQLSGGASGFTTTDGSGNYTFTGITDGTAYTVTPSKTGYDFSPTSGGGSVDENEIHDFTASISQHTISGTISSGGTPIVGVTVTLTGDVSDSAVTDASGNYTLSGIPYGTNYTITPTKTNYQFTPTDSSGVLNGDADIDFDGTALFSISGTITEGGNPAVGVTVSLTGGVTDSTTTDVSGNYTFADIPAGAAYVVTPSQTGLTFSPTNRAGNISANLDLDFTATRNTYTISGTITEGGSPRSGVTVDLGGDVTNSATTDGSGNYSFAGIPHGSSYTVTPSLVGYFFSPLDVSGTLTGTAVHDFTTTVTAGNTKIKSAFLGGTETTAPITPTNLNQTTAYPLIWSSSEIDNAYFDHSGANPERLSVTQAGDYFISATVPVVGTASNSAIEIEVYVNGVARSGAQSESAYIRNNNSHTESSSQVALLLDGLSVNDYIEVHVRGTAGPGTITVSGEATLYAEIIESGSRTAFSATGTTLTSGSDLNVGTFPELQWTEGREDSGFTHSDVTNSEEITLDSAGDYLVFVNVPVSSSDTSVSAKLHVRLDGSTVTGGEAKQGFIRNSAGHNDSSLQWSGIVRTSSTNQVLTIATEQEAGSGTITLQSGKAASIFIEELPASGIYYGRGTQVTGASPTDWNAASAESVLWESDLVIDSGTYAHSTSTNAHQVTVQSGGDYLLVYNDSLTGSSADTNQKISVLVNGTPLTGAETKSHYISNLNGHNESSGSLVTLIEDIDSGDVITVTTQQEAGSGTVTADGDSQLILWKKSDTHIISGTITVGGSPLAGVDVALSGDASRVVTTDGSGNYSFSGVLDGASYTVTPTLNGYTFTPTDVSGTLNADTTHDFTASLNSYTISGTITDGGSPLQGVSVVLSGGATDSTTTDASGNYSFTGVNFGVNYTVTPTLSGYVFDPTDVSGTVADNTTHDFTTSVATYSISGRITRGGSALPGVTVTLSGDVSDSTTTDANGDYTFSTIAYGTNYTVTPSLAGNVFTPTDVSGTLTTSATHDFTAALTTHTISGTITDGGSPQSGVAVVLSGDVSDLATTDGSGNYSFTVDYGTSYTVTPSLSGYGYTPASSSGTVSANVVHDFVAGAAVYTISGTVTVGGSPLSGVTISLTGDTTDSTTTDGSGNYSLTGIPHGTNYTVTPSLTGYTFSPINATGTLTSSSTVDFSATLNTYDITGTILVGGSPLQGVTVTLTGTESGSTTTDSNGDYTLSAVSHGSSYTVTPSITGYTFSPTDVSGTLTAAATHDFTATALTYDITGTITDGGSPLVGVTVSLSGDVSNSTTTDGSGNYTLASVPYDSNYTVTPSFAGYRFTPSSTSGTISGAVVHDFTGAVIVPAPKYGIAFLQGTQTTAPSTPTNINQATGYPLEWSSSNFDADFFTHSTSTNSQIVTIERAGDYLISATVPMTSLVQRSTVQIEVFVNGSPLAGSIGESSYIRSIDGHNESSSHVAVLAPGLNVNDTVELYVTATAETGTVTINSQASLYLEYIHSSERTAFSATGTRTVASTDFNGASASAVQWSEGRKDSGITHDDVTDSHNITLDGIGSYMVFVNIPYESAVQRANAKVLVRLDGATVPGGQAKQGYIRSDSDHFNASAHWSGIVTTTSTNQVLTIETIAEAGTGAVTVPTGKVASIFVEQLDTSRIYFGRGTELTGGDDWNVASAEAIRWVNDDLIDTNEFTHSTSSSEHEVEIDTPGDYLAVFNSSLISQVSGASSVRTNPKMTIRVNGSPVSGAETKTHYVRGDSGHQESSSSLVFLLEGLVSGDKITVMSEQEAITGENNADDDAQLILWRKTAPYSISGTITLGGSPLAGVTVTLGDQYSGTTVTDASGNYTFTELADGETYSVTPTLANYVFSPTSSTGTLTGNVVHDFTASPDIYTISGTIMDGGSPLSGVTVTLSGDVSDSTTTDGSGNYSFASVAGGTNYTVTPSLIGYDFSPTSSSGTLSSNTTHDFTGTVQTFTLSGTVTQGGQPRQGVTINLTGDVSNSAVSDVSGNYSFTLDYGTNYTLTPSLTGYTFSPSASAGTLTANTVRDFTASAVTYSISGNITLGGSPLSGVTVTLTGDESGTTTTDGAGNYTLSGISFGSSYTVTPTLTGYTFTDSSESGVISGATVHDFTATPLQYTISGTINDGGSPLAGVTVTLTGGASGSTTTDGSGNYSFAGIDHGTSYVVIPSLVGYSFSPTSGSGILSSNTTHDFTGTLVTYSISGTITVGGQPLQGVTVDLGGNVSGSTTTDVNGDYSFGSVGHGANYTVTPTLDGYTFTPTFSGGNLTANTDHDFSAVQNTYSISGTITDGSSPQAGVTVTLSGDQSGTTTTDGSGNYTFSSIPHGTSYTVTPTLANYTFSPTSSSGTLTGAADHDFTAIIDTYTISGTITVGGSPQSGVTVNLTGDTSDSVVTDGSGNYSFANVPHGTSYTVTPLNSGYSYSPSTSSGVVADNTTHDFTGTILQYSITGRITEDGTPVSGASVALSGDTTDSTTTDGNGDYAFNDIPHGTNYTVTPTVTNRVTTPVTSSGTLTGTVIHNFTTNNTAPDIAPLGYQEAPSYGMSSYAIPLSVTNTEGDPLSYNVYVVDWYSADGDAFYVDSFADFEMDASQTFLYDTLGLQEKWIYSRRLDIHYIILPNGEFYEIEFGRTFGEASFWSDSFDSSYYDDPTKFFDVAPPSNYPGISGSVTGTTLTMMMNPQESYDVGVVVTVSDGTLSDTEAFGYAAEGEINNAPVLTPIADRSVATDVVSFDVNVTVSDPDSDPVTLTVAALDEDNLIYELDQFYNFSTTGNFQLNAAGYNEKWFLSSMTNEWFVILPSGDIYKWNFGGGISGATFITTVATSYYTDPTGLMDVADPGGTFTPTATEDSEVITVTLNGYVGTFTVLVIASDGTNSVLDLFEVTVANTAPVITPIADQTLDYNTLSVDVGLAAVDAEGDPFTFDAHVLDANGVAYYLDQELDFYLTVAGYMTNSIGQGEKWIRSATNNLWYIILPDGSLYQWVGPNFGTAVFAGQLDSSFHADPSLMFDVATPSYSAIATATILGNTLTIDRTAGFVGTIGIGVDADDGTLIGRDFFNVVVSPQPPNTAPVLDPIPDQLLDPVIGSVTVTANATDGEGDTITYNATPLSEEELVYTLDGYFDFFSVGTFLENSAGHGEKWIRSNTYLGNWYVILPNGEIYLWNFSGGLASSTFIVRVDTSHHTDPNTLIDVATPSGGGSFLPTANVSGADLTINSNGQSGNFAVLATAYDGRDSDFTFFRVEVKNTAPIFDPISDQTMNSGINTLDVTLSVLDPELDAITITATVLDLPNLAYFYDQMLDFYLAGSYMTNSAGQGEKWIRSATDNQWYLILPNGDLLQWGGTFGGSTYITTFAPSYHTDPTLLFDVVEPSASTDIIATIDGNTLTLDRIPPFTGDIEINVVASDGVFSVNRMFVLTAN